MKRLKNKKDILRQKMVAFEHGAKVPISEYNSYFGGGAANAAVSLARLGFKTSIMTKLGNDDPPV